MKRRTNKGFTLTELIIVIVIIGILAAVLIPTLTACVKKAKISNDKQLVRNLNTALAIDYRTVETGEKHKNMYEALLAAEDAGYNVGKINATKMDNEILWDAKNDVFCYLNGEEIEYIPSSVEEGKQLNASDKKDQPYLWKIMLVNAADENEVVDLRSARFSIFAKEESTAKHVKTNKGFDAGDSGIIDISYDRTGEGEDSQGHDAIIRTNSAATTLTINAEHDNVKHFDALGKLVLSDIAYDCYYEYGKTEYVQAAKGKIVAKEGGEVKVLYATVAAVAAVEDGGSIVNAYCVSTTSIEETAAGYNNFSNSKDGNVPFQYVDENSQPLTSDKIEKVGDALIKEAKANEEVSKLDSYVFWEDCIEGVTFDGGIGTEVLPYLVSSPMQLALISHNVNNGVSAEEGCIAYDEAWYSLNTNINLAGKAWTPIGNEKAIQFGGKILGNGYKIDGLTNGTYRGEVTQNHTTGHIGETYGLIGYTKGEVIIQNITLSNVNINYDNAKVCAALVGNTGSDYLGSDGKNVTTSKLHLIDCHVDGNIKGYDKAAGLVGYLINVPDLKVDGCTVAGAISLTNYGSTKGYRAGGLFGYVSFDSANNHTDTAIISNCTVFANLSKGDSTSSKFWIGAITSGYNSATTDMVVENFKFDGSISDHNLVPDWDESKFENHGTTTGNSIDISGDNVTLIGAYGKYQFSWLTQNYDGKISAPTAIVEDITGTKTNRKFYHLSVEKDEIEESYSFTLHGVQFVIGFNNPATNVSFEIQGEKENGRFICIENGYIANQANKPDAGDDKDKQSGPHAYQNWVLLKDDNNNQLTIQDHYENSYYNLLIELLQNNIVK